MKYSTLGFKTHKIDLENRIYKELESLIKEKANCHKDNISTAKSKDNSKSKDKDNDKNNINEFLSHKEIQQISSYSWIESSERYNGKGRIVRELELPPIHNNSNTFFKRIDESLNSTSNTSTYKFHLALASNFDIHIFYDPHQFFNHLLDKLFFYDHHQWIIGDGHIDKSKVFKMNHPIKALTIPEAVDFTVTSNQGVALIQNNSLSCDLSLFIPSLKSVLDYNPSEYMNIEDINIEDINIDEPLLSKAN